MKMRPVYRPSSLWEAWLKVNVAVLFIVSDWNALVVLSPIKRSSSGSHFDLLSTGGPPYITPIFAGGVLPSLLSILSAGCPQSLTLAILETLNMIADRLPLEHPRNGPQAKQLSALLFSREHIRSMCRIIDQTSPSINAQLSITLVANLIAKTCTEETHKMALAETVVLDALAVKLASFVVAQGFVLPGAENHVADPGALGLLPQAAPINARLAPILRAIAVIIEHSKSRADHFLSSPAMVTVFPKQLPEFSPGDIKKNPWGSPYFSGYAVPRQSVSNPIDAILP